MIPENYEVFENILEICLDFRYIAIYIGCMRYRHTGGIGRRGRTEEDSQGHHHGRHQRHRGGRSGRFLDYGELRLLVLALIADDARHGYELIKAIEERFGGSYSPSPGVIYPTLSWLEDAGYAAVEAQESGRKKYRITKEGQEFLSANRAAADELLARAGTGGGRHEVPAPVVRAMENLKLAMRLRLRRGGLDKTATERIASALDAAARTVEES